jgi:type IV pilus biogenesis protein CpaD/CtpE
MHLSPVLPLFFVMTTALTACEHHTDSVARLNDMPFGGTNEANIAVMVVNPADLMQGRGQKTLDGPTAASPVLRLLTDHPKQLLKPGQTGGGATGG